MAVGYRSSSNTGNSTNSTSRAPAVPTGAAAGDVVVVFLHRWESGNPTVTGPAGFTRRAQYTSGDGVAKIDVWWKRLTGSDAGTYSFSWTGSMFAAAHAICMTGVVATGDPIEAINNWAGTAPPFGSTSVTTATIAGLLWYAYNDTGGTHTPPTSPAFTELADADCDTSAYLLPGTSGTFTVTGGSTTGGNSSAAVLLALSPASGAATHDADAAVTGTSTRAAAASAVKAGAGAFTATGAAAAAGSSVKPAAAALAATGTATAATVATRPASAAVSGTAAGAVAAAVDKPAAAGLTATATRSAAVDLTKPAVAALTVTAAVTAEATVGAAPVLADAAFTATATRAAAAVATRPAGAGLTGDGSLAADATGVRPATASVTGVADRAAAAAAVKPVAAALLASATVAAEAMVGALPVDADATLAGHATITAGVSTVAPVSGGWGSLLAIVRDQVIEPRYSGEFSGDPFERLAWQQRQDRVARVGSGPRPAEQPVACPNDGEPLTAGPRGLHCRFDGWRPD